MNYQDHVVYKMLTNAIALDRVSHAYLLEGERGTPKVEVARRFIKRLYCEQPVGDQPCEVCATCIRIEHNNYPDIVWIEKEGVDIKKHQIESLQHQFNRTSLEGKKKVYVINEVDLLRAEAANSLLKFLEEPHPDIHAILLTDQIYKVIKTIRSRCQVLSFPPLQLEEKSGQFESDKPSLVKLAILIYKEDHLIKEALETGSLEQLLETVFKLLRGISKYKKQVVADLGFWHEMFKSKEDLLVGIELLLLVFHDMMHYTYYGETEILESFENEVTGIANVFDEHYFVHGLEVLTKARGMVLSNMNRELFMDRLIMDLEGGGI